MKWKQYLNIKRACAFSFEECRIPNLFLPSIGIHLYKSGAAKQKDVKKP